ncbi:MAG TPA: radical SAM family heme chaperone HemW [Prolixibacteraceae bacterium]|nr:radical SAM family heme chaperone HemW [Prolixibacteraceae bacterium]
MAGIYFHIPFCKQRCTYCDFYKSTKTDFIIDFVKAVKLELWLRRDYLGDQQIETIYFGGGTPSLLSPKQIEGLLNACKGLFSVNHDAEITLEANPDDLNSEYLFGIKNAGINRLSIGIQSFSDSDLQFMGRRHNSAQAIKVVADAQEAGFDNISVDLIYGIPNMPFEQWQANLQKVFNLKVQHLSAYHLTYHKGTKLWKALRHNEIAEIDEDESVKQFTELVTQTKEHGFVQYEISNFAKNGLISKHNTSYWQQSKYLGLGPSAHSYNQISRQWNISSVKLYLDAINKRQIPAETEVLSLNDCYNDYIITSLRTVWGIDTDIVERDFGVILFSELLEKSKKYIQSGHLLHTNNIIKLEQKGIFISDAIMADLMN